MTDGEKGEEQLRLQLTEFDVLEHKVAEWVENGGREQLVEVAKQAREAAERVREDARPDPEILRQPMTI